MSASASGDRRRLEEDARVAFAIFCDENELTLEQGRQLAEQLGTALADVAEERAAYLPPSAPAEARSP